MTRAAELTLNNRETWPSKSPVQGQADVLLSEGGEAPNTSGEKPRAPNKHAGSVPGSSRTAQAATAVVLRYPELGKEKGPAKGCVLVQEAGSTGKGHRRPDMAWMAQHSGTQMDGLSSRKKQDLGTLELAGREG